MGTFARNLFELDNSILYYVSNCGNSIRKLPASAVVNDFILPLFIIVNSTDWIQCNFVYRYVSPIVGENRYEFMNHDKSDGKKKNNK